MNALDDSARVYELRALISRKTSLKKYYEEVYRKYAECLTRCPTRGLALELGSGAGFVRELIRDMVTSDVIPYPNVNMVVDATRMPFQNESLRAICMLNVFHHISDVSAFLNEAQRCLISGGRVFLLEEYPGWISTPIYRYIHHEPFCLTAKEWKFESPGALSGANGALAWIVFDRDRKTFEARFSQLRLERYQAHTPLRYWLSGGLKRWSLLPGWAFPVASLIDRLLITISPRLGSFVDIELVKA